MNFYRFVLALAVFYLLANFSAKPGEKKKEFNDDTLL